MMKHFNVYTCSTTKNELLQLHTGKELIQKKNHLRCDTNIYKNFKRSTSTVDEGKLL